MDGFCLIHIHNVQCNVSWQFIPGDHRQKEQFCPLSHVWGHVRWSVLKFILKNQMIHCHSKTDFKHLKGFTLLLTHKETHSAPESTPLSNCSFPCLNSLTLGAWSQAQGTRQCLGLRPGKHPDRGSGSGVECWAGTNSRDSRGETAIPVTTTASTTPGINSEKVLPVVFLKTRENKL